jgi:hypothetical protein
MKQTLIIVLVMAHAITGYGRQTEFPTYSNGLIYDDTTMTRLKFIVDSLNLKFKKCDLTKNYYAIPQVTGHYIRMETGDVLAAWADIQQDISYEDFVKKYPAAVKDSNVLITVTEAVNYKKQKEIVYHDQTSNIYIDMLKDSIGKATHDKYGARGNNNRWVYIYSKPYSATKRSIIAFYIPRPPASPLIPEKYARLILYSDCMIDTGTTVILENAKESEMWFEEKDSSVATPKLKAFEQYIEKNTRHVVIGNNKKHPSPLYMYHMDSLKRRYIHDSLSARPVFKQLLADAVVEAFQLKYMTSDDFEYYTAGYYSKNAALNMLRNKRVYGSCSMDPAPRVHAMNIAKLAAEATNWQVFLRAHLDIMNDRFERTSDGSYAWGRRQTYIREIEDLDIHVQDLMLGIALRINNASGNHYFGDVGRLGRAFAETKNRSVLEQQILSMITDPELDDYNRLLMHYLFLDYLYYLPEKESRLAALQQLEAADKTLPGYLVSKLKINKAGVEKGGR